MEEAAALNPRFKGTVTHDDAVWERLAALVKRIGTCATAIQQEPAGCESDCAAGNSEELEVQYMKGLTEALGGLSILHLYPSSVKLQYL